MRTGFESVRYLDVDLASRQLDVMEVPADWIRLHLGGRGVAARLILEAVRPRCDPLGPENVIVIGTGPMQGTSLAGSGRYVVAGISPKTGSLSDSYAGGFFAAGLIEAGYDGVIIRGASDAPVYLTILDEQPALHDARALWGREILDTENELRRRHGDVRVLAIGPAGENLAYQACIISDRNRAAGRPGFGAVLGAKRLKAIAVRGTRKKRLFDEERLNLIRQDFAAGLMRSERQRFLGEFGTAGYLELHNEKGIQPARNFAEAVYDQAGEIGGEALLGYLKDRDNCTACPVRCKRVVELDYNGEAILGEYGGPEYETLAAFGTLCLNSDLASICLANQRCNALGLDTISTGVSIAFAMEASERGLLKKPIRWGDTATILSLVEDIAHRRGLGDRLASGIERLALELQADFAMVIKGQEIPLHEPRGKKGLALTYATTPRGGQHMEGIHDDYLESCPVTPELGVTEPVSRFSWQDRAVLCKIYEDLSSFDNSLILCDFVVNRAESDYNYPSIREALFAATGLELSPNEMVRVGERNYNLLRLYAGLCGRRRQDDVLPPRFSEPLGKGASAGESIDRDVLEAQVSRYYEERGWSDWGPTRQTLISLGLQDLEHHVPE